MNCWCGSKSNEPHLHFIAVDGLIVPELGTLPPPRDPNQVPDPLKDDIGKHNESDFNDDPHEDEGLDEDDEDSGYRDDDDD